MQRAGRARYNRRMVRSKSGGQRCEVAMLVDVETGEHNLSGRFVPDRGSMEERIFKVLGTRYSGVAVVPFGPDIAVTVGVLQKLKPRIVLNLTEWLDGDRKLDQAIAGLLDLMRCSYTGTGPLGMQLCRDKALSKRIVAAAGVDVPRCFALDSGDRIGNPGLPYPLFVKPQFGDASAEIGRAALVRTARALRERVKALRSRTDDPVICEEYIEGRDLFVGVIGNEARVLAPIEMIVGSRHTNAPKFATYRIKNDRDYRARWQVRYRCARLPRAVMIQVGQSSRTAFRELGLRDYARIDYRLTAEGRLVFIEANPNPDLNPHTFGRNLCFAGIEYRDLIFRIIETARGRCR